VGLSGPLDVTAFYKISNHGPALGGVSAGLRIMSGGTSDDTVSRSGVSTSEGGPLFVHLDSVGFLPLTIRIIGHASAGGDTFGGFSVAITEIKVNNQVVFTGPEPPDPFVPEPASSVLAALAVIGAAMIRRR
jgi:hypothetical protein